MPAMSIKLGEEGVVEFRVLVNTQGRPEKVEIVKSSGFQRLDDAVIAAVKKAVFEPHIEDGKAITVSTTGKIGFTVPR
jgi:protein TonB